MLKQRKQGPRESLEAKAIAVHDDMGQLTLVLPFELYLGIGIVRDDFL